MRKRPIHALPYGINLSDYLFAPDAEEIQVVVNERRRQDRLAKLHKLEKMWERQDLERLRRRAAELESVIAADKEWLEKQNAWDAEIERRKAIILKLHDEDAKLERERLLARLEKATKTMNAEIVRSERAELSRRGVVRGRKS